MPTLQLHVSGKVHGVFYRASAKEQAISLGLTGWVRNTDDDAVEIMVHGEKNRLDVFLDWCKKGPKRAVVENVVVSEVEDELFDDFKIAR